MHSTTKLPIVIPSKGRTDLKKQLTWRKLHVSQYKDVCFVVPSEEQAFFLQLTEGTHATVLTCDRPGVPAARQHAVDVLHPAGYSFLCFLDDDLRFMHRPDDWTPEFPQLPQNSFGDMLKAFKWMEDNLRTYAAVGLGARGGNHGIIQEQYRYCKEAYRMMRAFAVDLDVLDEEGIRFDRFDYWEDFDVTLQLLKRGYPNLISTQWLCDGLTNEPGGVSLYRDVDSLRKTRDEFVAEHAPYAKAVDKEDRYWKGWENKKIPDVRVQWKKCYLDALERMDSDGD